MDIVIARLTSDDLAATGEVIKLAYNIPGSREDTLRRYLALQPEGAVVAKSGDTVVGFGDAFDYGPFAYIGMIATHPSMQRQGIGQHIMEYLLAWLDQRGCPTSLLDASAAGIPLYPRFGYVEEDQTTVLKQIEPVPLSHHLSANVSLLCEDELAQWIVFDAHHFGTERGAVLTAYRSDDLQRVFVSHDDSGRITGYLLAQPGILGPWIASNSEDAEHLLLHALTLPFSSAPQVFVSAHHHAALTLLEHYGFQQQRTLSHMRRGQHVQRGRRTTIYGQISLGMG